MESLGYIRQTLQAMEAFSLEVEVRDERTYWVPGGQRYRPAQFSVEGDYSQAAGYFCAPGRWGLPCMSAGWSSASAQGDSGGCWTT